MRITSAKELGGLVKATRRAQGMTQANLAGTCGTGIRFIVDLERGKPTCALEKTLRVVFMLSIRIEAIEPLMRTK